MATGRMGGRRSALLILNPQLLGDGVRIDILGSRLQT